MNVTHKDATITNTGDDGDFPGSFQVVLSTATKDRDGDELALSEWKQPLPEHITFDTDHGMSVATTVGSGKPYIKDGKVIVDGTYSSLQRAQDVRTLVNEKHIRTVSVAFASEKVTKDGKTSTQRELLNGAFVAIPANTEAVVLASKGLKAGARHSAADKAAIQKAHDALVDAGADCAGPMDDTGAEEGAEGGKSFTILAHDDLRARFGLKAKYDAEQLRQMLKDGEAIENADGEPSYPIGDKEDLENAIHAVGRGNGDHDKIRAYIIDRAKDLDASDLIPDGWNSDGSKAAGAVETKALSDATTSVSVSGYTPDFCISINAYCVAGDVIDAYSDTAQRALIAALTILTEGPVDDDGNTSDDTEDKAVGTDAKSMDAEHALELQMLALKVIASAHID